MQLRDNGNWSGGVPQPFQRFSANHNEYGVAALPPSKFELSARYRIKMNSHFAITSERMPPRMKSICQLAVIMEATLDDYDWKTLDVVLGCTKHVADRHQLNKRASWKTHVSEVPGCTNHVVERPPLNVFANSLGISASFSSATRREAQNVSHCLLDSRKTTSASIVPRRS
ncbi:hypothetical protein T4E_344 [Trichinella pseudospiralis]|uniref:Uncharacterized protein n=1 Tax=Trichinella pseudospiralis TaxID=6337 RepID=A0A0V0XNG8_TRIPS|nr:hypothetical protein T4E_344 [Trichinella pseudospiralis]